MSTFRSMNCDVVVEPDEPQIADAVAGVFARAEARFSRFRDDSELTAVNRACEPIVVSQPMFDALIAARRYVELTDGIFDPGIGGSLVALGYDRSFAPGALDRDVPASRPPRATLRDLELDAARCEVFRPPGLQIDLGGMIKGRTTDEAAALLPDRGAIDAGGDVVVRGPDGWLVGIEDPRDASEIVATIRVREAVATSTAAYRRWRVGGVPQHHLVDPRTHEAARTDLSQVTVVAPTAELAEVLAKTVFVLGSERGREFLARAPHAGAMLIDMVGTPIVCGTLEVVS